MYILRFDTFGHFGARLDTPRGHIMDDEKTTPALVKCDGCNAEVDPGFQDEAGITFCFLCRRLSPVLQKALTDQPFDYACGLTTGEIIRFGSATIRDGCRDWVWLEDISDLNDGESRRVTKIKTIPYPCPRGIEVRIDSIIWLADAPQGS
jgi:hypothetical protein